MGKIRKNLASILVFFINLILMGVGFLFIKNSDEAKKNNLADNSADVKEISKDNIATEKTIETPIAEKPADIFEEKVESEKTNITASTAPISAKPKPNSSSNNTSNTSSSSTSKKSKNTSSSSKKSSATTKTS